MRIVLVIALFFWLQGQPCAAKSKPAPRSSLREYLERVTPSRGAVASRTPGSLWSDNGKLSDLAADYKAQHTGDLVEIVIVHDTVAENSGDVASDRSFQTSSGIQSLPGHISTSGVQNLLAAQSSSSLKGKAQATSRSRLRTTLAGRVVAVLPNGNLVIEAAREVSMNNERQTVVLRGLTRPGDIGPDNSVLSTALSDLEIELKGRGVISDTTRQPNLLVRWLLRLLTF
jgi:flagellar L-ring protein precursor FlgH